MRNAWILAGFAAVALSACGGGDASEAAKEKAEKAPQGTTSTSAAEETHTEKARVTPVPEGSLAANPMILGPEDAAVSMVEYASVTCPGCAMFHKVAWPIVDSMLVEPGVMNFEFREFPTHPQNLAYAGFYLARCTATHAGPKAYYRILKTLFDRQNDWAYGPDPGGALASIASQAGIDKAGLEDCFFREDIKTAVTDNVKTGVEAGVSYTPSFFIADELFSWEGSPVTILNKVETELAAKGADGIPSGTSGTVAMPIDFCESILQNTEKALGRQVQRTKDDDDEKVDEIPSPDGGKLVVTCSAPTGDPLTHALTIVKMGAQ